MIQILRRRTTNDDMSRSADNPWNANAVEVCSPVSWRKAVGSPFLEATYGV